MELNWLLGENGERSTGATLPTMERPSLQTLCDVAPYEEG
jgi:hypothetical protein